MRALLLLVPLLAAFMPPPPDDVAWLKLDQAKAIASHTNKLIFVYVACDPRSGNAPCSGGAVDRAFSDAAILKRQDDFHFVRVCDKKTALQLRATKPPEAIVLDADGDEVDRAGFTDAPSLERVLSAVQQRYSPREIRWGSEIPLLTPGKQLLVVGFDDDKGDALKPFEDRLLVKFHDRIEFVKYPAKRDSEHARKWGVSQGPAIFICDAGKDSPEKNSLEKLTGKKSPSALKSAIQKAFQKLEAKK